MCVTFYIPQAPKHEVQPFPDTEPGLWIEEPQHPFFTFQLNEGAAEAFLELILPHRVDHLSNNLCGELREAEVIEALANVHLLIASPYARGALLEPNFVYLAKDGRTLYTVVGRDMDYVMKRLLMFQRLLQVAAYSRLPFAFA